MINGLLSQATTMACSAHAESDLLHNVFLNLGLRVTGGYWKSYY